MQISFTPEFSDRLKREIFKKTDKAHNPHGGGNTYELERHLGEDILLTSVGWANNYYQTFEPGAQYTDDWGMGWTGGPIRAPVRAGGLYGVCLSSSGQRCSD